MYLVFDLPPWKDQDPTASTVAFIIHRELQHWYDTYKVEYHTKFHKNRLRLIFPTEQDYTFFLMCWHPDTTMTLINGRQTKLDDKWLKPRVVDPPKH